jgi:hypothetical protein
MTVVYFEIDLVFQTLQAVPMIRNPDSQFSKLIDSRNIKGLTVFLSPRLKKSWHVKISRSNGHRTLTLPSYLESAPDEIKAALIEWALLPLTERRRQSPVFRRNKVELERRIQSYIKDLDIPHLRMTRVDPVKLEKRTMGCNYDLRLVFDDLNRRYFGGSLNAVLRWGSKCSLTSYQSTRIAADGTRFNLITIAGVYNHPEVPQFAIEAVMYHEMLHIVIPPYFKNGRHVIHGREFKQHERDFEHYELWREWEKTSLRALARKMKSCSGKRR